MPKEDFFKIALPIAALYGVLIPVRGCYLEFRQTEKEKIYRLISMEENKIARIVSEQKNGCFIKVTSLTGEETEGLIALDVYTEKD